MSRKREIDLDIVRGMIIVMVAFYHSINTDFARVDHWFQVTYLVLSMIMMPTFMFVSGIVLALSSKPIYNFKDYLTLSLKRMERLLVPYLLLAIAVFTGKMLLQQFLNLEKTVAASDVLAILIAPKTSSFASYLWFIYILLEYYLVVPLIQWLAPNLWLHICLVIGVVLHFVPGSDFLGAKQFNEFLLFFVLGIAMRKQYDVYLRYIKKFFIPIAVILATAIALIFFIHVPILVISLLSIPTLHQFARTSLGGSIGFFRLTGAYMYPIYLTNVIFINTFKAGYSAFFPMHGFPFVVYTSLCVAIGTFGPITVQRLIISRIPYFKSIIR